ncbi:Oligosaccharide translocation protein rft1 [Malassezia vespertilionis]|uniref:Man(5)GlcNAc(2)-PP-dolichol translocation protein RFT1 n=1 Tax=Malassezia vespertilionis TaxID=2020962 RepID=A0A2N1J9J8_9BASI|nr:Oligosaccharide translocation protein rft1 [Malassezia vespertilionis]PKI83230.1 Rft1p [Malassezia vespertilionis]WFD07852.1 Oligosaccharide translocation protein rft1 [Malassezia vespertilionis]
MAVCWATALYVPLGASLRAFEDAVPRTHRFIKCASWPEYFSVRSDAPRTLAPVPVQFCLAQYLVMCFLCHAPYATKAAPEKQPFRPALQQFLVHLEVWPSTYDVRARQTAAQFVRRLLDGDVAQCAQLVPIDAVQHRTDWNGDTTVHMELDLLVYLLYAACDGPLQLHEQRWALAWMDTHADIILSVHRYLVAWPPHVAAELGTRWARAARFSDTLAYRWICLACEKQIDVLHTFEQLGGAFADMYGTHSAVQRRIESCMIRLARSTHAVATADGPIPLVFVAQTQCIPRYLGMRIQALVRPGAPQDSAPAFCAFATTLIEQRLLPVHIEDRAWDTIPASPLLLRAHNTLDALAAELRSVGLHYSTRAFGAALFAATTQRVERAISSARALLVLQIGVRVCTFVLTQMLVRTASPAVFGAANVQLELVLGVVLALARDGVRAAVLREREQEDMHASVHNIALLPIGVGAVLAGVVGGVYRFYLAPHDLQAHGAAFSFSVGMYCAGAVLELCAEPLYTYALGENWYVGLRTAMEGGAVLLRACSALFLLRPALLAAVQARVHVGEDGAALLAFAASRAAYGLAVLVIGFVGVAWYASMHTAILAFVPQRAPIQHPTWSLVRVTTAQAALKFLLAEGDKMAVAHLTPLAVQGGYALASNYGSLLARTVFQPLEESARLYFGGMAARAVLAADEKKTGEQNAHTAAATQESDASARQGPYFASMTPTCPPSNTSAMQGSAALLALLLHAQLVLGTLLITFGPPLAHPFLLAVAGPRWAVDPQSGAASHAAHIFSAYFYYLPIMGINGLVEAFLQSTAAPQILSRYSYTLLLSSLVFVGTLWIGRGEAVLVLANCAGLGLRAYVSWRYMYSVFAPFPALKRQIEWQHVLPSLPVLGVCAAAGFALRSMHAQLPPFVALSTLRDVHSALTRLAATTLCTLSCILAVLVLCERQRVLAAFAALQATR